MVGAEITSARREFHKLTTLLGKKLCLTSSQDPNFPYYTIMTTESKCTILKERMAPGIP